MKSAMKTTFNSAFMGAVLLMVAISIPSCQGGSSISAVNRCSFGLTVFRQDQSKAPRVSFNVPAGQSVNLNIPTPWVGGVVWGSQTGNTNNGQCTQLEFNINTNGNNRDFYDVSVVNAYNVAAQIQVAPYNDPGAPNGLECGAPTCSISNINSVCVMDNYFAGPDHACINGDGPGTVQTSSVQLFTNACPTSYTLSSNNKNVVYGCTTGSAYDIVFCP